MDNKLVVVLVLAVAVIAVGAGFMLRGSGEDTPIEEDESVCYTVTRAVTNGDGTANLWLEFDADPGNYYIYFKGQELLRGDGKSSMFSAADSSGYSDHAYGATPWVKVPYGTSAFELKDEVELRSYSLDLVRSTL